MRRTARTLADFWEGASRGAFSLRGDCGRFWCRKPTVLWVAPLPNLKGSPYYPRSFEVGERERPNLWIKSNG